MSHANTLLQVAADFLRTIRDDTAIQAAVRAKQMERARALHILHRFQRYRRGRGDFNDIGYTPKEIGLAIDFCIRELRAHFSEDSHPRVECPAVSPQGENPAHSPY